MWSTVAPGGAPTAAGREGVSVQVEFALLEEEWYAGSCAPLVLECRLPM
jgi:hypothetical protein